MKRIGYIWSSTHTVHKNETKMHSHFQKKEQKNFVFFFYKHTTHPNSKEWIQSQRKEKKTDFPISVRDRHHSVRYSSDSTGGWNSTTRSDDHGHGIGIAIRISCKWGIYEQKILLFFFCSSCKSSSCVSQQPTLHTYSKQKHRYFCQLKSERVWWRTCVSSVCVSLCGVIFILLIKMILFNWNQYWQTIEREREGVFKKHKSSTSIRSTRVD